MPPYFLLITVLALSLTATVHAQENAPTRRWSIGASLGTGLAYRSLINTDGSVFADQVINERNEREKRDLAIGGGFFAGYRISDRLSLEAGVAYARLGYVSSFDLSDLTFGDIIDPRRGFVFNANDIAVPSSWRLLDRFHYLEVPIGLVLELGKGRWRSSTTVGVAPAFLLAAQGLTVSTFADGRVERELYGRPEDFASFNLVPYISTGISMHPGGRWSWMLRPTFRLGALDLIDAPVSGRVYSATLELGVRYDL
ncbi:MAG: outer membrane beta-barrel protein [Flavobacteriales bacterium]|jgi:hypothetical protein|nr:outer membrane beta-barrel protein [Flavobacteriales bacterium]